MDYERLLLSKVAQTGRIQNLLIAGIREDHFSDEQSSEIFRFMADHARTYKQPPSFDAVRNKFPDYYFEVTEDAVQYLLDGFMKKVERRYAMKYILELASAIDDPEKEDALPELFLERSRELAQVIPTTQLHKFSQMDERIQAYEIADPDEEKGIQMGIPYFDNLTMGFQAHEYITIMGWTGTGKSTLAQWMLFNAWAQGKTPMLISLEMEAKALFRKWDTMMMHFLYHDLKSHNLREEEIEKWRTKAEEVKMRPNDILVLDDVRYCTVDKVYGEVIRWKPDILCIDYVSLMDHRGMPGHQNWEKISSTTHALKQIARTTGTPIIGIAQTNRDGATRGAELDNVAFSAAIIHDSDIVLGLYNDDDMKANKQMQVRLNKNRDGATGVTDLLWDMSTMTFMPWSEGQHFINRFQNQH